MSIYRDARFGSIAFAVSAIVVGVSSLSAHAQVALQDQPRPAEILLGKTDEGIVFTDSRGMTLYYLSVDVKPGASACTDEKTLGGKAPGGDPYPYPDGGAVTACTYENPPLLAKNPRSVGEFAVIDRPGGGKQWAFRGMPLYTSIRDYKPGDAFGFSSMYGGGGGAGAGGAGAGPAYAPVILPPEVRINTLGTARLLSDNAGYTLYTYALDSRGKSSCEGTCAQTWKPLLAPSVAVPSGDWTITTRSDKSLQWAFKGKPLYTSARDIEPDMMSGAGEANWEVALAYPVPTLPSSVTTQLTAIGPRYADAQGKTLYVYNCNLRNTDGGFAPTCDGAKDNGNVWHRWTCGKIETCADIWRPVVLGKDVKLSGVWSVVTLPEPWAPVRALRDSDPGQKVLAYKGRPVFRYKFEEDTGMIEGEGIGFLGFMKWMSIRAIEVGGHKSSVAMNGQTSVAQIQK